MEKISSHCQPQICSQTTPFLKAFDFLKVWWHASTLFIYFYINRADIQYLYILLVEYHSFESCSINFSNIASVPLTHAMLFHRELCSSNSHWCAFLISQLHTHISFVNNRFSLFKRDHPDSRLSPLYRDHAAKD
jgi:hypothetical protein